MLPEPRFSDFLHNSGHHVDDQEEKRYQDLLERLVAVGGDLIELHEDFYPLIGEKIDTTKKLTPRRAVRVLSSAIEKYESSKRASITDLGERAKDFINALIPEDEEARREAWALWRQEHSE